MGHGPHGNPEIMKLGTLSTKKLSTARLLPKKIENMTEKELEAECRRLVEEDSANFGPSSKAVME